MGGGNLERWKPTGEGFGVWGKALFTLSEGGKLRAGGPPPFLPSL